MSYVLWFALLILSHPNVFLGKTRKLTVSVLKQQYFNKGYT